MFTPSMTKEEIEAIAYKDYLEIKTKVNSTISNFENLMCCALPRGSRLHSIQETHTFQTSSNNTWNLLLFYKYTTKYGLLSFMSLLYTTLPRNNGTDYLFMSVVDKFELHIFTSHFLKRYRERYLDPKQIKLNGFNPALYFIRTNSDMAASLYTPNTWTEQEKKEKSIFISSQGLMAVKVVGNVTIFLTFMDQEHLTNYRSMVYDEEWILRQFVTNVQMDGDKSMPFLRKIYHQQDDIRKKMYHFMRRCSKSKENYKENCKLFEDMMDALCHNVENYGL